jgi:hypothetical protein
MNPAALHNRCWNHEAREAVCRCPGCSRGFCRECVAEHEQRLLCAACLRAAVHTQPATSGNRLLARIALAVAGLLLAWVVIFLIGEAILTYTGRLEQTAWVRR